jgi:8-oxo-dGTP pyrophosphatase MutT (NUDIX family)
MAFEITSHIVDTHPLPAATVMVVRDGADGHGLEVLMMRRHANSGVLGGAHVFPGGKVDAADQAVGESVWDRSAAACCQALNEPDLDGNLALGLYAAAVRETFEECGLVLAAPLAWQTDAVALMRGSLDRGAHFIEAMQSVEAPWAASSLLPWSRWVTPRVPSMMSKRFDTRFFVALAPPGQLTRHCEREATEAVWLTPQLALERAWSGGIDLAPPQIMSLSHLAMLGTVPAVLAWARNNAPALIEPNPLDIEGERVICYPGDAEHSLSQMAWPGATTRLTYRQGRFVADGGLVALLGA